MPSKPIDTALRDILHHIELAANFSTGFDRTSFKQDVKTVYAVTRCLEIISEASRRLPNEVKARQRSPGSKWLARETSIAMITKTLRLNCMGNSGAGAAAATGRNRGRT
jgi:uncharacterized protein with HEPN domain